MNALTKTESTALAPISESELMKVLRYEPTTGEFFWLVNRRGGAKAGDKAGTVKAGGYIQIIACGKLYYAHRLAWLFTHGVWPIDHVDHINGNQSNNQPENLRDVTHAVNQQNQRRAHISNKSSGLQGASFDSRTGRWLAKISINCRTKNLGRFDSAQAAHAAYVAAKRQFHEGTTL